MTQPTQNFASMMRDKAAHLWHIQRVKTNVRQQFGSATACMVSITEIICQDPGCEGFATEIRIVSFDLLQRLARIHKPVASVDDDDVRAALTDLT